MRRSSERNATPGCLTRDPPATEWFSRFSGHSKLCLMIRVECTTWIALVNGGACWFVFGLLIQVTKRWRGIGSLLMARIMKNIWAEFEMVDVLFVWMMKNMFYDRWKNYVVFHVKRWNVVQDMIIAGISFIIAYWLSKINLQIYLSLILKLREITSS